MKNNKNTYTEESIKSLDWKQHIRLRPGMYIGKLGDGSAKDDGIYVGQPVTEGADADCDRAVPSARLWLESTGPGHAGPWAGDDFYGFGRRWLGGSGDNVFLGRS